MRQHLPRAVSLGLALGLALTACAASPRGPRGSALPGHWVLFRHVPGVVDLAGPGGDGSFTVAAAGRLFILSRARVLRPFARGQVRVITSHAPVMEGGIAVAPASFGRYGGDLVAPGETSGRVFAIGPDGSVVTLVVSGLPHGGDIGVESAGFVPPGFSADEPGAASRMLGRTWLRAFTGR